jgi:serine/threonine-protein kinase
MSPDGRHVAYFDGSILHIYDMNTVESVEVLESDGATSPFWSPDGQWLAFGLAGRIYKVAATGGKPVVICDVNFSSLDGAAWSDDGKLFLAPDAGPLRIVSEQGGDAVPLFPLGEGETDYHTPTALPGGRGVLFTTHDQHGRETIELYADGKRNVLLKIPGARLEYATWAALATSKTQGHIVYHRLSTNPGIWAMPFDLSSLTITGDPFLLDSNGAFPSVGRDGSLLYANASGFGRMRLVLVDRHGKIVQRIGDAYDGIGRFSVSPDGKSVLVEVEQNGNTDIWLHDIVRGSRTRMTFTDGDESWPGWLGDGSSIHYATDGENGKLDTWARPASGVGEARMLVANAYAASSVPGNDAIVFTVFNGQTSNDLYFRRIESTEEPTLLLQTPASEYAPILSPTGRLVAYVSNESGGNETYLIPFPDGDGKWQVSTERGVWPRWSRSGDELIFRSRAGSSARMISVSVQSDPELKLGSPVVLFSAKEAPTLMYGSGFPAYDSMPDSDLLMMLEQTEIGSGRNLKLVFIEDWYASYRTGASGS